MQRVDDKIRYYTAQTKANDVLLKYSEGELPINSFKIVSKIKNITLLTFSEFAKKLQNGRKDISIEEIKKTFESERGFLKKKGSKYILAYNENDPIPMIRWTIFHELGHYFLGHLEENESQKYLFCNGKHYKFIQEREANCFARHCCSPGAIAAKLYFKTGSTGMSLKQLFKYYFDMSEEASKYCSNHFSKYSKYYIVNDENDLIKLFKKSINITARNLNMKIYIEKLNDFIEDLKRYY